MGKVVLTPLDPFLRNIKSRQSNPYNMAPIKASLHRSQFSSPVLFLDYGGRDNEICNHMTYYLPAFSKVRKEIFAIWSAMPRSFKA